MDAQACILALKEMTQNIPNIGATFMREAIRNGIKHKADSTGNLENSVTASQSGYIVEIKATAPYAKYVDDGRGGFGPKNAPFLQWHSNEYGWIRTMHVGPMEGINFAETTADKTATWINNYNLGW